MAPARRKDVITRRRRTTDEDGEEEGSQAGDFAEDSLSEGSVSTDGEDDADVEASDFSDQEPTRAPQPQTSMPTTVPTNATDSIEPQSSGMKPTSAFPAVTAETKAMMNGVDKEMRTEAGQELHFDEAVPEYENANAAIVEPHSDDIIAETPAQRSQREHDEYLKERKENPAFVPTRGGFFLHDNRTNPGQNGFRPGFRGRGRGRGPLAGVSFGHSEPSALNWVHDLHETVTQPSQNSSSFNPGQPPYTVSPNIAQHSKRSFSTTSVLGNVPVVVFLPGMKERQSVQNIAKKQHTLLPNHRPPLRRDKPVRVSIPDSPPRYIFPAVDRSFIFIPRALRPNQQSFVRGRGRGSFHGSRRTSAYGSTYTPSVAMSRRSSFGRPYGGDDLQSPSGSIMSRGAANVPDVSKPVVRLPPSAQVAVGIPPHMMQPPAMLPAVMMPPPSYIPMPQPIPRENQPMPIPMHQPRPQKAVSVADIESPGTIAFNPPPQQIEQPFHQQVPARVNGNNFAEDESGYQHARQASHPSRASGTPLSQIPERAIHAQPFQPYPMATQGYFAGPYPGGPVFYPGPTGELAAYHPVAAPPFVPQAAPMPYMVPAAPANPAPQAVDPNSGQMVAHESNGMVYYYDSNQLPAAPGYAYPMQQSGGVVGMGGMMTPPGGFYYPSAPGGVYYAPQ